jgi:hypothetical protein
VLTLLAKIVGKRTERLFQLINANYIVGSLGVPGQWRVERPRSTVSSTTVAAHSIS